MFTAVVSERRNLQPSEAVQHILETLSNVYSQDTAMLVGKFANYLCFDFQGYKEGFKVEFSLNVRQTEMDLPPAGRNNGKHC